MPSASTSTGTRNPVGMRAQRGAQSLLGQQRRVDAAGERAQVLERGAQAVLELDRQVLDLAGVLAESSSSLSSIAERDELLLGAVVQVPLDPVAFLVLGAHQPPPRCRQVVDGGPQLGGQPQVAQN